jgi:hypothetical protein
LIAHAWCAAAPTMRRSPLGAKQSQPVASDPATPSLANIVTTIQFLHLKLAYAGRPMNWPLAGYELDLIQQSFDTAARRYPVFKEFHSLSPSSRRVRRPLQTSGGRSMPSAPTVLQEPSLG